jgi:hypothetical protein
MNCRQWIFVFLPPFMSASAAFADNLTVTGEVLTNTGYRFPDGSLQTSAAANPALNLPVRCRLNTLNNISQNLPIPCESPDGVTYENVPDDRYFYVTDIIVSSRLGGQTEVAASVRIWKENFSSPTGCSGGAVVGSFVTSQYIVWNSASGSNGVHRNYETPYLVLTPNDCLAVYTGTSGGLNVEVSGYFSAELGVRN